MAVDRANTPTVKWVEAPKDCGGIPLLRAPAVADRLAQKVLKLTLDPLMERAFPFGPLWVQAGESATQAVGWAVARYFRNDWILDLASNGFLERCSKTL